jgi:hypothetical protein
MTRMALLPPKAPAESISILRKAFDALSRDQDFLQDAITAMRFQPRFEVGSQVRCFSNERQRPRLKLSIFCGSTSSKLTGKAGGIAEGIGVMECWSNALPIGRTLAPTHRDGADDLRTMS